MKRYISMKENGWKEVDATPLKNNYGLDLFIYKTENQFPSLNGYVVTEGTTGMQVFGRPYKKDCTIMEFIFVLAKNGLTIDSFKAMIPEKLKEAISISGRCPNE